MQRPEFGALNWWPETWEYDWIPAFALELQEWKCGGVDSSIAIPDGYYSQRLAVSDVDELLEDCGDKSAKQDRLDRALFFILLPILMTDAPNCNLRVRAIFAIELMRRGASPFVRYCSTFDAQYRTAFMRICSRDFIVFHKPLLTMAFSRPGGSSAALNQTARGIQALHCVSCPRTAAALLDHGVDPTIEAPGDEKKHNIFHNLLKKWHFQSQFYRESSDAIYHTDRLIKTGKRIWLRGEWRYYKHASFAEGDRIAIRTALILARAQDTIRDDGAIVALRPHHPQACWHLLPAELLQVVFADIARTPRDFFAKTIYWYQHRIQAQLRLNLIGMWP
jgi:hypothetical protein